MGLCAVELSTLGLSTLGLSTLGLCMVGLNPLLAVVEKLTGAMERSPGDKPLRCLCHTAHGYVGHDY